MGHDDSPDLVGDGYLFQRLMRLADLDVDASRDGTLNVVVSNPQFAVDVTLLSDPDANAAQIEALFESLLPILLGDLGSAFGRVALPSIAGFSLENTSVRTGGGDAGFLVIEGELAGP